MKLIIILLCLGYIGWPAIDFIPDVTPFIGTADDSLAGAIFGLVLRSYFSSGNKK
jgi:uncharacterized membrane protein YkvA (DUF1232 family)